MNFSFSHNYSGLCDEKIINLIVNILAIHDVAECIVAFIDIYIPIIVSLVAGKISPHPIAKIRKIVQNNKYIRIFLAYTIKNANFAVNL